MGGMDGGGGGSGEIDGCEDAPIGRLRTLLVCQQRAALFAQDAFGGGAEQHLHHEMFTPCAHHQQVGLARLDEVDQGGGGGSLRHCGVDAVRMVFRQMGSHLVQASSRKGEQLRFQGDDYARQHAVQCVEL